MDEENIFAVSQTVSGNIVIGYYRGSDFSPDEALNLAAHLLMLALESGGDFQRYIDLCERIENERRSNGN